VFYEIIYKIGKINNKIKKNFDEFIRIDLLIECISSNQFILIIAVAVWETGVWETIVWITGVWETIVWITGVWETIVWETGVWITGAVWVASS